jgi:hypothetical protein
MGGTWVTASGSHRVTVVTTVDRGQFVTVERWSGSSWGMRRMIRPPAAPATPVEVGDALIAALARYLNPAELIEAPSDADPWETEGGSAARWSPG